MDLHCDEEMDKGKKAPRKERREKKMTDGHFPLVSSFREELLVYMHAMVKGQLSTAFKKGKDHV